MRILIAAAPLALVLAAPAQAAVTMDPLKPCYVSDGDKPEQRESVHVHVGGFTPLSMLTLVIDGEPLDTEQADAFGEARAIIPAPFQGRGQRPFTLTVRESPEGNGNGENFITATPTPLVTNLGVTLRPSRARPSRRIRFSGRGFTQDAPVYGHYLFGGKVRKTVRFARRATLPCGTFQARGPQIPVRRPATGNWLLQVDQQRKYAPLPGSNAQRVVIRVTETFKKP